MSVRVDHVFICCAVGAPEADALLGLGLREGSGNTHPGQGTACRRFFFEDAYLELLWVSDASEAQSEAARATRLYERWSERGRTACPFGIVLAPSGVDVTAPPFPSWPYRPSYMPAGLAIDIARDTPLREPEFFYLGFQRDRARLGQEPIAHALPLGSLTNVTVARPAGASAASEAARILGLVAFRDTDEYLLELGFDSADRGSADLRPPLPLVLRW